MAVSNSNEYSGYSEEVYDGFSLYSQYLNMRDDIKLAIDIYRPTKGGKPHTDPLPVIWAATQYRRAAVVDNEYGRTMLADNTFFAAPGIERILKHGYIIAVLDSRGTGASFGSRSQQLTLDDANDLFDVNEWLASQPWCCGKTGMFGTSYLGRCQWTTALMAPPSLKCIVPMVASMEYPTMNMNGIMNIGWMKYLEKGNKNINTVNTAPPVDEDSDGSMLLAAVEEHKKNPDSIQERSKAPFMDSYLPGQNRRVYMETYFPNYLNNINNSGVAVYIWGGMLDFQAFGSFQWYSSLNVPKKMVVGSWAHTGQFLPDAPDWTVEHLRWYDYWLKGIDNGIMDEPPISIQHSRIPTKNKELLWDKGLDKDLSGRFPCPYLDSEREWRHYDQWPVPNTKYKDYYFTGEHSGTIQSINDGLMIGHHPSGDCDAKDEYVVDYTVTRGGFFDRNMFHLKDVSLDNTPFDEKSLTYTTPPLAKDIELTGFPVAHLWVSSSASDVDFYVNMEEVDADGFSWQITEGKIRAAFRGTFNPPFDNMGLPWHRYCERDQKDIPINQPVKLDFALFPVSCTITKGNRLRVTINNFDKDNWDTPVVSPPPTIFIYREKDHESYISLPVIS
jgi:predicted acyl esterase